MTVVIICECIDNMYHNNGTGDNNDISNIGNGYIYDDNHILLLMVMILFSNTLYKKWKLICTLVIR